eukprot:NODE_4872_length_756_cov_25.981612_g4073_i0.p2 GENE.NODE_4872_length_756_cov_25.981612_g4073_i0~~NODE_4872_length_756_cov_25.981612_g4073_i0.p2  ORF type:complete len:186 (-),score=53.36 NODE_4872_length_756_cov_25.981612_g4073_i0:67-624(-)
MAVPSKLKAGVHLLMVAGFFFCLVQYLPMDDDTKANVLIEKGYFAKTSEEREAALEELKGMKTLPGLSTSMLNRVQSALGEHDNFLLGKFDTDMITRQEGSQHFDFLWTAFRATRAEKYLKQLCTVADLAHQNALKGGDYYYPYEMAIVFDRAYPDYKDVPCVKKSILSAMRGKSHSISPPSWLF